jgi:EpsI family protein
MKRQCLKEFDIQSGLFLGSILTGIGCLMLFAGKIGSTMIIQQLSLIVTLLGIIWLVFGFSFFKALFLPISYFVFTTGILEELLGAVSIHLQNLRAQIAAAILNVIGMPVLLSGTLIQLPHITLEVAKVCSGISHISVLLALAVPIAYTFKRTAGRVIALCVVAVCSGILANGLRIALIAFWTRLYPGGGLHGPGETLFVTFIFFFGAFSLFLLSHIFRRRDFAHNQIVSKEQASKISDHSDDISPAHKSVGGAALIGAAALCLTLLLCGLFEIRPVDLDSPLAKFNHDVGGFRAVNNLKSDENYRSYPPDEEIYREYVNDLGERFELYMGYYRIQEQGKKLIDYRRDWLYEGSIDFKILNHKENFRIQKSRNNAQDLYFWYVVDDHVFSSRYEGKIRTFFEALFNQKTNGAVVILKTKVDKEATLNILNVLVPMTQKFVNTRQ